MKKFLFLLFLLPVLGLAQSVDGGLKTLTASGTDTYRIDEPLPTAYSSKERFLVRFTNACSSCSSATLNRYINGSPLGAKAIKYADGSSLNSGALTNGDLKLVEYNGTYFQIVGISPTSGITSGSSILKGNGSGGFSNAASGTDYAPATSGASILYGNGSGGFSNVTIGSNLTFIAGTLAASGGGGITNTAANLELGVSNGTNIVPSGLSINSLTPDGSLNLGLSSTGGGSRTLAAIGGSSVIDLDFTNKGAGAVFQFNTTVGSAVFKTGGAATLLNIQGGVSGVSLGTTSTNKTITVASDASTATLSSTGSLYFNVPQGSAPSTPASSFTLYSNTSNSSHPTVILPGPLTYDLIGWVPGSWTNITLINGWAAGARTPQYRIINGEVQLRGDLNGSSSSATTFSSTLPTTALANCYGYAIKRVNSSTQYNFETIINGTSAVITDQTTIQAAGYTVVLDMIRYPF